LKNDFAMGTWSKNDSPLVITAREILHLQVRPAGFPRGISPYKHKLPGKTSSSHSGVIQHPCRAGIAGATGPVLIQLIST
jgi:hypothetical protein